MHNGCGHISCHFNSKCAHGATQLISKAKQCSRGPLRAFKTQNKTWSVEKPWLLECWLKGAFKEHLKQFYQTQCIETEGAEGAIGCVVSQGQPKNKEQLLLAAGKDTHDGNVWQVSATALLLCRTARAPFAPTVPGTVTGTCWRRGIIPLPAPDYFGRAKLRLKWFSSKPGNFCLLYASLYTYMYV